MPAAEGEGPQLKANAGSNPDQGIDDESGHPLAWVQKLQTGLPAGSSGGRSFPRAGCTTSACPVR